MVEVADHVGIRLVGYFPDHPSPKNLPSVGVHDPHRRAPHTTHALLSHADGHRAAALGLSIDLQHCEGSRKFCLDVLKDPWVYVGPDRDEEAHSGGRGKVGGQGGHLGYNR